MNELLQIQYSQWFLTGLVIVGFALVIPPRIPLIVGIAASLTGFVCWFYTILHRSSLDISYQLMLFIGLILIGFVFIKRMPHVLKRSQEEKSTSSLPHKGYEFVLSSPIQKGHSKMIIEGREWEVVGPDMPEGTPVKVISKEGGTLYVRKI